MNDLDTNSVEARARALSDHLGVGLWRALTAWEDEMYARAADRGFDDISEVDAEVLIWLPPAGLSVSELARRRGVSKQAMSQAVAGLATRDYVGTAADPDDRRVLLVRPSPRGRAFAACLATVRTEMQAEAEAALGAHKVALLNDDLKRIAGLFPER